MSPAFAAVLEAQGLQTLAALRQQDPPRYDIGFEAISTALSCRERLLMAMRQGRWQESDLLELEDRIEAVGGWLAPNLTSSGPESLRHLRELAFAPLHEQFSPPARSAALAALGSVLRYHQPADLLAGLTLQRQLLAPLLAEPRSSLHAALQALEPSRQAAMFHAWGAAHPVPAEALSSAQPPSLEAVIAAFAAEARFLDAVSSEAPVAPALTAFHAALQAVGCPLQGLPITLPPATEGDREATATLREHWRDRLRQRPDLSALELLA